MVRRTAAERKLEEEERKKQYEVEKAAYRLQVPLVLLRLMARIDKMFNGSFSVRDAEGNITVKFDFRVESDDPSERGSYVDSYELDLESESWQVAEVEAVFDRIDEARKEADRMRQVAIDAYEMLLPEQRLALKVVKPS